MISEGLVEQHIHGAFGIDFMNCSIEDIHNVAELLAQCGVCAFFPTIMTDDLEIIKERLELISEAKKTQKNKSAQIIGVHLEGPFINPEKKGIHDKKYIIPLDINYFKQIENDIIKIITIAPELDFTGEFIKYLKEKDIKISLGHSVGYDLEQVNQVTHLYNAMEGFSHRGNSTVVSSLVNKDIYTEIIADSIHVSDDVLRLTFETRPLDKILLISDALPLAHSTNLEHTFAGQKIFNRNGKLVNEQGTFAGSSMLLCDIIKNLADKNILKIEDAIKCASSNQINYHKINNNLKIYWNENNSIQKIDLI